MLRHLSIKDFAVVRATELEFAPGMTVVSGETGAGKSLMVDALGFLSGVRADSGVVRHGAERAELSAEFELPSHSPAFEWLRNHDMDDHGQCQLRRVIRADGRSRAWINGRSVTLSQLAEFSSFLVEIHGQHEHQALLEKSSQLALLDAFAQNHQELAAVRQAAKRWQSLLHEQKELQHSGDVTERMDYLHHQLEELQREDLTPDTLATLTKQHRRHAHASQLLDACQMALSRLGGDETTPSVLRLIHLSRNELARLAEYEPRLTDIEVLLENTAIQLQEALNLLMNVHGDLDIDHEEWHQIERRIGKIHDLARKHRIKPDQLEEHRNALEEEFLTLSNADQRLHQLQVDIDQAKMAWQEAAQRLTQTRETAANALSQTTTELIHELGMSGGIFDIQLEPQSTVQPDISGAERVEFMVAANTGQPPRPLRKVASGGELARISLAIEVAALGLDAVPTMVFDEVDTGIGGAIAEIVGQKLRTLGETRQVLCVTHLPQVAAQGHWHYRVSKAPVEGMTQSSVEALTFAQREDEIARMLGGVTISQEVQAAAKQLLSSVGKK